MKWRQKKIPRDLRDAEWLLGHLIILHYGPETGKDEIAQAQAEVNRLKAKYGLATASGASLAQQGQVAQ